MMQHPLSRRSVMASALALTACGPQPAGTANDLRIARELDGIIGADWPDQGLSGNGIRIGIIDAGFGNFRSDPFTRALDVETIRDFVPGERPAPFESADRHGTQMAQFIGGRDGRRLRGLAHRAQYLLAIGEDQSTEPRRDEDGVIAALDWLVSEGVKLVNISLGYTRFDDASPYAPGMMDGRTARISRHLSALLEADPMLVAVVSAGNQGRSDWQFVTSPGDVEDAITVGSARGAQPERRPTSGIGNPDMAFIKPDLVARSGGGASSVATAIVTGLVACLREQYPEAGRALIAEALRRTASAASTPDRLIGHGVPDAQAALDWLSQR